MIQLLDYMGKQIYYLDISQYDINSIDKIEEEMNEAKELIANDPSKACLAITDVSGVVFNTQIADLFKDYAKHNTPYVKASALVGIGGVQKVILMAVKRLTGRDFYLANTLEEAKEWVVKA